MSRGSTLLFGIACGALGVILFQRLRRVIEEEDPETLADRLAEQLDLLEQRSQRNPA